MANQNIAKLSTLYAQNQTFSQIDNDYTDLLTCESGTSIKVNSLYITNNNLCSISTSINLVINDLNKETYIVKELVVPYQTVIILIDKESPIYLEEYETLKLNSSIGPTIDAMINYDVMKEKS
jgi:hypothetical protein